MPPIDLLRMDLQTTYRSYRNDWFRILHAGIPEFQRPKKPLKHCRLIIQIYSNKSEKHLLDAEA